MSGFGERFKRAGYKVPKPLIEVESKPIISHVIDLFGKDNEFIFICNEEHLKTTNMEEILSNYVPNKKICSIKSHKKGPVYAVSKVFNLLNDEEPVIINYCDFSCYWDFEHFKKFLINEKFDGVIPSYRGFHPHSLGITNYAYLKIKNNKVLKVQEKKPFTNNRMNEYASSGTYYFKKGSYVKKFFQELIDKNIEIQGEYYCSLIYNLMVKANLNVGYYELEHFMQWGTPQDLEEYMIWSKVFRSLLKKNNTECSAKGSLVLTMAGKGKRFIDEGYKNKKPLIEVSNKPMFIRAINSMPNTKSKYLITQGDNYLIEKLNNEIKSLSNRDEFKIKNLRSVTEGQAISCIKGLKEEKLNNPITVTACDHACLYDENAFLNYLKDTSIDIIVWGYRKHANAIRNPHMYGWINEENNFIKSISVKKPLEDPTNDPLVVGTFTFRNYNVLKKSINSLVKRKYKVNGEYYIDSAINDGISLGYKCKMFEIDHYICWGTPNELKTFNYWQNCFSKWKGHPYSFKNDQWIIND